MVQIKDKMMFENKKQNSIGWNFDNSYRQLPTTLYSNISPTEVEAPKLALFNHKLASELGLDFETVDNISLAQIFSGNTIPEGAKPIAQAYAGHQFGHFNMLGDGRAILLGEQITADNQRFDIQLKGSGPTQYSRNGDGRATLSSMLREYLMSEAMNSLNIPTSRSLAVAETGEKVRRENLPKGAVLTRVAQSHIRVGTFEYVRRFQSVETLKEFTNYVINRHFPEISLTKNPPLEFLKAVINSQIELVVNWMRVGFIHGVMNTDNTAISGESTDYGPCAFMNSYDSATVFSSIDTNGRYAFGNQAAIIQWNLSRFAESLLPLIDDDQAIALEKAKEAINSFPKLYNNAWLNMMRKKLGLKTQQDSDLNLVTELLTWMTENKADYSNTFLKIQSISIPNSTDYENDAFKNWMKKWESRLESENQSFEKAHVLMIENNPFYIPRNHQVEAALKAASEENDFSLFNHLLEVLSNPYIEQAKNEKYQIPPLEKFENNYRTYCGT